MAMTEEKKAEIYRQYRPKVERYLCGKVNNSELAEDLASEVFLKVMEKMDTFDETKASVSTWIFTITRNTLIDYYRTRRVAEEIPESLAEKNTVEESVLRNESLELLAEALSQLDERERRVVVERYYNEKTLREIAEELDVSYAYVKVLQSKALNKLKPVF